MQKKFVIQNDDTGDFSDYKKGGGKRDNEKLTAPSTITKRK